MSPPPTEKRRKLKKIAKRCLLLTLSGLVSCLLGILALKQYVAWIGAEIEVNYLCDPRPVMWQADPLLGYSNKPNLEQRAFGNLVGRTNSAGFRSHEEIVKAKPHGTYRVVGVGDSVMWGMRVNLEETFLGQLGKLLETEHSDVEFINAGVIGYSTYQERMLLEKRVVPYSPDLVLINFSSNDLLPTEDPFESSRELYVNYLTRLSEGQSSTLLNEAEQSTLKELVDIFKTSPKVWETAQSSELDPKTMMKLLIEIPMTEMASIAKANGIRLIYVFIPVTTPTSGQRSVERKLQAYLKRLEVETIDLYEAMLADPDTRGSSVPKGSKAQGILTWHKRSGIKQKLDDWSLSALDPFPALAQLGKFNAFRERHTETNYIDTIGHPSERGNRIIAEKIFEYLQLGDSRKR
ncbi:MAG: hypothetical protein ACI8TQ_003506 [Planctomycetota bacterium]|jgi:hypothetical protein